MKQSDIISPREFDAAVPGAGLPQILLRPDVPNVRGGIALHHYRRVIGRAVVIDDQLVVREALIENAVKRLTKIAGGVERRNAYADLRRWTDLFIQMQWHLPRLTTGILT